MCKVISTVSAAVAVLSHFYLFSSHFIYTFRNIFLKLSHAITMLSELCDDDNDE